MKKIIFILLFLLLIKINVFALDQNQNKPDIQTLSYTWYYQQDKEIELRGSYLDNCKINNINNLPIDYLYKNNSFIFNVKQLKNSFTNLKIKLICNQINYIFNKNIPYIDNYEITKDKKNWDIVTIKWKNFWENPQVFIWNKNFKILNKNKDNLLVVKLNNNISNNQLYIQNDSLKSNLINLPIQVPKIDYIQSDNWFSQGTTLKIYFKNLTYWSDLWLLINNKKINILKKDYHNNYIEYKTSDFLIWNNQIQLEKDWFKSNIININIYPKASIIKSIVPWINNKWKAIYKIIGQNFINNKENFSVYLFDNKKLNIEKIESNQIIVSAPDLSYWNNFFYIINDWIISNIYNYKKKIINIPSFTNIINDWINYVSSGSNIFKLSIYRILKIWVSKFNKNIDNIFINWNKVSNVEIKWWIIKVLINQSINKWKITLSRNNQKLDILKTFDFEYQDHPSISYIKIWNKLKAWTQVTIYWDNFSYSNINSNNFFRKKDWTKLDITVTDKEITWYLTNDFNKNTDSSISISNNWLNTSLNFNLSKVDNPTKINWKTIIKSISTLKNWVIYKIGDKLNIIWKYFHPNDKIFIDNNLLASEYLSPTNIQIRLPDNNKFLWIHRLSIKNSSWIESDLWNIFIYSKNDIPSVEINEDKIDNNKITINNVTHKNNNKLILNYKIDNKFYDIQVNKVIFKIKNFDKNNFYPTFKLINDSNNSNIESIDKNWYIIFKTPFIIPKNINQKTSFSLQNDSDFMKIMKLDIELYSIEWIYHDINWNEKKFTNFKINNNNDIFYINYTKNFSCIDSENKLINCNDFVNYKSTTTNNNNIKTKVQITPPNIPKITNTKSNISLIREYAQAKHILEKSIRWKKIILVLNRFLTKNKNNLNTLNTLKIKIQNIKTKIQNKNWVKYFFMKNIINYLNWKLYVQIKNILEQQGK